VWLVRKPRPIRDQILPFDAGWRFHLGDDPAAKLADFDDSAWRVHEQRSMA